MIDNPILGFLLTAIIVVIATGVYWVFVGSTQYYKIYLAKKQFNRGYMYAVQSVLGGTKSMFEIEVECLNPFDSDGFEKGVLVALRDISYYNTRRTLEEHRKDY